MTTSESCENKWKKSNVKSRRRSKGNSIWINKKRRESGEKLMSLILSTAENVTKKLEIKSLSQKKNQSNHLNENKNLSKFHRLILKTKSKLSYLVSYPTKLSLRPPLSKHSLNSFSNIIHSLNMVSSSIFTSSHRCLSNNILSIWLEHPRQCISNRYTTISSRNPRKMGTSKSCNNNLKRCTKNTKN